MRKFQFALGRRLREWGLPVWAANYLPYLSYAGWVDAELRINHDKYDSEDAFKLDLEIEHAKRLAEHE